MSDGNRLASGYVEVTVKAAKGALKDLEAEITGVATKAEKAGQQAGEAIDKGVRKGATKAGETIRDAITAGAEKAGADAGKAAGDGIEKGVRAGAEKAGKSAGEVLDKGISDAAKRSGKTAGDSIGGSILESVNKNAKAAGIDLNRILVDAAGKAGGAVGRAIGDTSVGQWLQGISGNIAPAVDGIRSLGDAIVGFRDKDAAGAINGVAGALTALGQNDASKTVQDIATRAGTAQQNFSILKDTLGGGASALQAFAGTADGTVSKLGSLAKAAEAAAGPLTAVILATQELQKDSGISSHSTDKSDWLHTVFGNSVDWFGGDRSKDIRVDPGSVSAKLAPIIGLPQPSNAPVQGPHQVTPGAAAIPDGPIDYKSLYGTAPKPQTLIPPLPGRAKGGVTPAGMIFGPGSGTSDSIIGVGPDGVPTARVSAGEGVVRKSAMDNGGAAIVAALNGGMKLPGFDDGTGAGGVPVPPPAVPPIQVPQATTGQAGALNDFLNSVQGHPYQYGTLYDCSGLMSQIFNQLTGKQMPRFNTESDLAAYGFVRGSKPGTFELGIHHGGGGPNSHMAGTLPDGRSVESSSNGVQIGTKLAHGAHDQQFEDHWYLPGSESMAGLGASITGAPDGPAALSASAAPGGGAQRTQGYIPAGAGGSGQAGSSFFSGALQMGAQAINGLIDQAASAASSAASMGANAFAPGSGGAAGAAASTAIGIGTQAAKRGVQYGFQLAGIGADAATEILMPFGVPRFFQTSPQQFMPQLPGKPAATTTGEKAQQAQDNPQGAQAAGINPSGPVQPGQMPGQQVVGQPAPIATPGMGDYKPEAPPVGAGLSQGPAVPSLAPAQPVGPQAPQSGPMAQPQPAPSPAQPPLKPTDLAGLLGLARGGVVPGKFDNGGWLMPNGIAINKTSRPEPILSAEQWGDMHAIASQGMPMPDPAAVGGRNDYSVRIENVTVRDVNEMQREIDSRQRLQRWRYGGRP